MSSERNLHDTYVKQTIPNAWISLVETLSSGTSLSLPTINKKSTREFFERFDYARTQFYFGLFIDRSQ